MKSDQELQREVMEELRWDPTIAGKSIGVAAQDGIVTLSGSVNSSAQKVAAERAAERVTEVKGVADDLTTGRYNPSRRPTDTQIAHWAVMHMKWDIEVPDEGLTVTVDNGVLVLTGTVKWNHQRVAAERAVQDLPGVCAVTNRITVASPATVDAVREKIVSALKHRAVLDAARIRVAAIDGRVTLQGSVRSWAEKRDAEHAAWGASGVTSVEDQMSILT